MIQTDCVNIYQELERHNIKWTASTDDEIKICCPAHGEKHPSAALNTRTHVWKCYVPNCGAGGDLVALLAYAAQVDRKTILVDLQQRYPSMRVSTQISSQTIQNFVDQLSQGAPLVAELHKRGITDDMIREARIGFHRGRLTIPIFNQAGNCVNVRRYLPGASQKKMINTPGHGQTELYRIDTITDKTEVVVICGGEVKALLVGSLIGNAKIAVVSSTGGEGGGKWRSEWTDLMKGRRLFFCFDIDQAGMAGARLLAAKLKHVAKSLHIMQLPLDHDKHPHGDVNDWIGAEGATAEDLKQLMSETPAWQPATKKEDDGRPRQNVSLNDSFCKNELAGAKVSFKATIAAVDGTPFYLPREVKSGCGRNQKMLCAECPIFSMEDDHEGYTQLQIEKTNPGLLGMVGAGDHVQQKRIGAALGVPERCRSVTFYPQTVHTVYDVRLTAPMDLKGGKTNDNWYPALVIHDGERDLVDLNTVCEMQGAVYPHPSTQQATALVDGYEELEDTLSTFDLTDKQVEQMKAVFNPLTTLEAKVDEIYADLANNVTWIYERQDLHIALDLAWHSPLMFDYGGRSVNGWLNVLVVGDSAQGKSETARRLLEHYGAGDKLDCKNATIAGVMGGLEQMGTRWFVRWGVIPRRDRTLVILEELKGMPKEVLQKLTEMRSSGVAEIPKIERRKTAARTRIVALSNPRSSRSMDGFPFGIQAVLELVGTLEDVRRFDLCIALARGDVSEDVLNKRPETPHKLTSDLCKQLVLWAWTRRPDQIRFTPDAEAMVSKSAKTLMSKFDESIPIVDSGTIRIKLARMSAAFAARMFSTVDGEILVVDAHHVQFIEEYLTRVYSAKNFGYLEYSKAERSRNTIRDADKVAEELRELRYSQDVICLILEMDKMSELDLMNATGHAEVGRSLLSLLLRKGALKKEKRNEYVKTPGFINLLRELRDDDQKELDDEF